MTNYLAQLEQMNAEMPDVVGAPAIASTTSSIVITPGFDGSFVAGETKIGHHFPEIVVMDAALRRQHRGGDQDADTYDVLQVGLATQGNSMWIEDGERRILLPGYDGSVKNWDNPERKRFIYTQINNVDGTAAQELQELLRALNYGDRPDIGFGGQRQSTVLWTISAPGERFPARYAGGVRVQRVVIGGSTPTEGKLCTTTLPGRGEVPSFTNFVESNFQVIGEVKKVGLRLQALKASLEAATSDGQRQQISAEYERWLSRWHALVGGAPGFPTTGPIDSLTGYNPTSPPDTDNVQRRLFPLRASIMELNIADRHFSFPIRTANTPSQVGPITPEGVSDTQAPVNLFE